VRGGGFQLPLFPDGAPDKDLLDRLVPDRPAYLSSLDGHSAWVNSRALELAGIDSRTPDPAPDGVIVRGPDGAPQGTLRESAMALVESIIPPHSAAEELAGLERALAMAAGFGITTLHEANAGEPELAAYAAADDGGLLTARIVAALSVDPGAGTAQVARLTAVRARYARERLRPVAAKIFLDGVIEGRTAALLAPYTDTPDFRGELRLPPAAMNALVAALDDAGFKVHVHAIGDRAIRVALDAFEAQRARDGGAGPRHIMAHLQLFDPSDLPRLAELGVAASFQPLWAYEDSYIRELTEPRLGPERSRWLYPIRSVAETGAIVAAGSDWSVTSMNPLLAIEVGITRRDPDLGAGPAWLPDERVDLETMLRAYTIAAAEALDLEAETGSIEVGKKADLVVLERDLFAIPPQDISEVAVDLTLFEGEVVFRRE
jgi:predicted amidohydrolase YtcJ